MKRTLTTLLIASVFIIGCGYDSKKEDEQNKKHIPLYSIVVIDSCEYLVTQYYNTNASLCHKGNCKNKIHIYNLDTITLKK